MLPRMSRTPIGVCLLFLASACSGDGGYTSTGDPLADMRNHITALEAKAEHSATEVRVKHVLIAFKETGVPNVTRSREDAEKLAAEVHAKAMAGEDFDKLMQQSDDTGGGDYLMVTSGGNGRTIFDRSGMVPAFGNVGWRLEVGKIGVAAHDPAKSRFGWHIIKRIK